MIFGTNERVTDGRTDRRTSRSCNFFENDALTAWYCSARFTAEAAAAAAAMDAESG